MIKKLAEVNRVEDNKKKKLKRRKPEYLIPSFKPMEITLIKKDKTKADLKRDLGISSSTLAKMGNNEFVALDIIALICQYLNCNIVDIVEFIENKEGDQ